MNIKRYRVTVEVIGDEVQLVGKEWKIVGSGKPGEKDTWGYTPEIEKTVEITRVVYEQTVESLDIVRLVEAVNRVADRA